ncbi:MAG: Thioredoxin-1 [Alphaproteobacteria bacterium MarineAlpha5_Bin9]|nr:MAG: Thioredoxin-1 [Alphaproteobacteria bacterium MarineAlpha5_Bin9]|tara:strand:+ start:4459 stop:5358 length:900 start_codon:yes stop_codon:yes gene_type:complete
MSEINNTNKNNHSIFDITENEFVEKVINESENKIILVDFWAPWCGPCKQLTPLLEEIVKDSQGIVSLAKINIDENQQIAAQLQIQSIPAVFAFYKKKLVNGFKGVIPKNKIIEFIEKVSGTPFPVNKEKVYENIEYKFKNNEIDDLKNIIEEELAKDPSDKIIISYYIKCLTTLNQFEEIKNFIDSLSEDILKEKHIVKEIENYKMMLKASKEPSSDILLNNYNKKPDDINVLIKLTDKYFFDKEIEKAFELLFDNYFKFKDKDRNLIKTTLIKYFDTLGNNNENTKIYRRKLSSLLFS